jgi:DNA-binding NarL/FixJ family response regulator
MDSLLIASTCQIRLGSLKQGLTNFSISTLIIESTLSNKIEIVKDEIASVKPQILLLDIDVLGLDGAYSLVALRSICSETKTVILSNDLTEDFEWELIKAGVRGCCRCDYDQKLVNTVVTTVQEGQVWVRRSLTTRFIDELSRTTSKNEVYRATLGLLNKLTQREYNIAVRVGDGESNKVIAQACGISEATVKSHLTEIFQKLGVTSRLNLALMLVADNRIASENFMGNFIVDSSKKIPEENQYKLSQMIN